MLLHQEELWIDLSTLAQGVKEGFPGLNSMRYLNTQYPILDRWDWKQLLVTYSHSPGKEDMAHHAGPHRGCTQELREPGGTGGGRFCSDKNAD